MTGDAHWFVPLVVLLGGTVLIAGGVWLSRPTLFRTSRRRLTCPVRREEVKCTLVQNQGTGHWVDVRRCTAFDPSDHVTCARACLPVLNRDVH